MKKSMFVVLTAIVMVALGTLPAFSQVLTSNITARAQDSTGGVIPGVEVPFKPVHDRWCPQGNHR